MGATLQGPWCDNNLIRKPRPPTTTTAMTNKYKQCQQQLLQLGETGLVTIVSIGNQTNPDVQIKLVCIARTVYCSVKIF